MEPFSEEEYLRICAAAFQGIGTGDGSLSCITQEIVKHTAPFWEPSPEVLLTLISDRGQRAEVHDYSRTSNDWPWSWPIIRPEVGEVEHITCTLNTSLGLTLGVLEVEYATGETRNTGDFSQVNRPGLFVVYKEGGVLTLGYTIPLDSVPDGSNASVILKECLKICTKTVCLLDSQCLEAEVELAEKTLPHDSKFSFARWFNSR